MEVEKNIIRKELISLHEKSEFISRLNSLSKNLFNLKLENPIRDTYVEILNDLFSPNYIALAEYPREKLKRVDMGVCLCNFTGVIAQATKLAHSND
jgi:hypothetical protein